MQVRAINRKSFRLDSVTTIILIAVVTASMSMSVNQVLVVSSSTKIARILLLIFGIILLYIVKLPWNNEGKITNWHLAINSSFLGAMLGDNIFYILKYF